MLVRAFKLFARSTRAEGFWRFKFRLFRCYNSKLTYCKNFRKIGWFLGHFAGNLKSAKKERNWNTPLLFRDLGGILSSCQQSRVANNKSSQFRYKKIAKGLAHTWSCNEGELSGFFQLKYLWKEKSINRPNRFDMPSFEIANTLQLVVHVCVIRIVQITFGVSVII